MDSDFTDRTWTVVMLEILEVDYDVIISNGNVTISPNTTV